MKKRRIAVKRYINGISLNDFEYLLDKPNGKTKTFPSIKAAKAWLKKKGLTQDYINNSLIYEELK